MNMSANPESPSPRFLKVIKLNEERNLETERKYVRRFLVKSGERFVPIAIRDVAYFCAYDRWTYLVSTDGKKYLLDRNLKTLEEQVDPSLFFRLNRRFFVKIDSIYCLTPYFKGQVTVTVVPEVKEKIVVSRKRTPELKAWIAG